MCAWAPAAAPSPSTYEAIEIIESPFNFVHQPIWQRRSVIVCRVV